MRQMEAEYRVSTGGAGASYEGSAESFVPPGLEYGLSAIGQPNISGECQCVKTCTGSTICCTEFCTAHGNFRTGMGAMPVPAMPFRRFTEEDARETFEAYNREIQMAAVTSTAGVESTAMTTPTRPTVIQFPVHEPSVTTTPSSGADKKTPIAFRRRPQARTTRA